MARDDLDRVVERLERRVFGGGPGETSAMEAHERRVRVSRLYVAYLEGGVEKPELGDPEDLRAWEHMGMVTEAAKRVAERVAAKGRSVTDG
jgi:hypothetical protein